MNTIYCPKCQAGIEAEETAIADGLLCQACGYDFSAAAPLEQTTVAAPQAMRERIAAQMGGSTTGQQGSRAVRARAESFEVWSILAMALGFILLVIAGFLLVAQQNDWAIILFSISGALMGLAGWLYLVAQIVHIRANTEK